MEGPGSLDEEKIVYPFPPRGQLFCGVGLNVLRVLHERRYLLCNKYKVVG